MKISNLKLRVSIPEIHVEWREAAESLVLVALSIFLYVSVVFTQFTFVPLMILTIKRGWKESTAYITISTILLIYIMVNEIWFLPFDNGVLLFSPSHYTFEFIGQNIGMKGGRFLDYYFLFGVLGIFLGYLVSKNYRLNYVVFLSLFVYIGIVGFAIIISGFIGGFDSFITRYSSYIDSKTASYINLYLAQMDQYSTLLSSRGVDLSLMGKKLEIAAEIYKRSILFGIAPRGGYLIKQIIIIFLSILFVKLYFKKRLNKAALSFDIKNYRLNSEWVWGLIASWGLVYINLYLENPFLGIISWNSAAIFSFLYFLNGLAIIKSGADILKVPQFLQYLGLVFLFFYSFIFFITIVTGIGVVDIWLKLHEAIANIQKRRSE